MPYEFKLPDIGEGVVEGEIVRWMIHSGDAINEDQPMVEVMTDKATVEIPSPRRGRIIQTIGAVGETVRVGAVLVVIEAEGASDAETRDGAASAAVSGARPEKARRPTATSPPPTRRKEGQRALASPATRKLARELGVEIETLQGTGPRGRVRTDDVRRAASAAEPTPLVSQAAGSQGASTAEEERIPFRGLRRRIAERMSKSKFTATHFTYVDEVDVTELVKLRDAAEQQASQRGLKLSFLPFIIKGVVHGLKTFPLMNASLDDASEEIVVKKYYNIGIAVATEAGLIVPVVKDADRKSVFELAGEIEHLAKAVREGQAKLEELQGGTFTITSLGAMGGLMATPIINFPEVAILGVHKIEKRPVVQDGKVVVRDMMNASISLDHRIVDGVVAAQFIQELFRYLQQPSLLFLDRL